MKVTALALTAWKMTLKLVTVDYRNTFVFSTRGESRVVGSNLASEMAHDMGYSDRYLLTKNGPVLLKGSLNTLMGTANVPLTDNEAMLIISDLYSEIAKLKNGETKDLGYTQPVEGDQFQRGSTVIATNVELDKTNSTKDRPRFKEVVGSIKKYKITKSRKNENATGKAVEGDSN